MQIQLNGQSRDIDDSLTVSQLLEILKLSGKPVAVEVNRELVPRSRHADHRLQPSDLVEVVTLVGGG
jgi:sulfur carrier protein